MTGSTLHRVILRNARIQSPLGRAPMRDQKDSFELDARPHIQSDETAARAG